MIRQAFLTMLGCATLLIAPATARADEPSECLRSFEQGQLLRKDRHFQDAKKELLRCSKQDCPTALASMCEKLLDEVQTRIPSVLIGVTIDGEDTRDARVDMDGKQLLTQVDVHELELEPGFHTFTFTVSGFAPVERRVAVREGEKLKAIQVVLNRPKPAESAATKPGANVESGAVPPGSRNTLPWIVVGAGGVALAVATGFGIAAINQHGTACPNGGNVCDAGAYDKGLALADTSTALFVIGGAAVAGGLVWYFVDRSHAATNAPKAASVATPSYASVRPFVGPSSIGLRGEFE